MKSRSGHRCSSVLLMSRVRGVGVEPGVGGGRMGSDTLLGPEESAVRLTSGFLGPDTRWVDGSGERGVCELDSGREHLWLDFTRSGHFFDARCWPLVCVGVGGWCRESL